MRVLDGADQMMRERKLGYERRWSSELYAGDEGDDIMKGAMVVLKLALNHEMTRFIRDPSITEPDGSKDAIICGDGKDEIWINFSIDGDQVSNDCEIIHKGELAYGYLK